MSVVRTTCCYFYTYCTFQLNTYPRYALIGLEHAKTVVSCCHTFTVPFSSTLDALIHWIDIDWIEAKNSDALTMNRIESNRIQYMTGSFKVSCHVIAKQKTTTTTVPQYRIIRVLHTYSRKPPRRSASGSSCSTSRRVTFPALMV